MTKFSISPDVLIGGSSEIDAIFLPVNLERSHVDSGGFRHETQHRHTDSQQHQPLLDTMEAESGLQQLDVSPSRVLMHALTTDHPDSTDWCYRASVTSLAVILVVVLLLLVAHSYIYAVLLWLERSSPLLAVSVLALLFTIICFPIAWGLQLLMLTAGYLYGILLGPVVVTLCVTVGLLISVPVMRIMCSGYLKSHFYSNRVEAIVNVVSGPHGMKVIALTRLTPIPFGLQNALFSLSSISLLQLLVASAGGLIPMNLLTCYMGSTLRNMQDLISADSNRLTGFFILGGQVLMTLLLSWFVIRKARVELKKTMDESDVIASQLHADNRMGDGHIDNL